ncbi:A/G-specific adenine glycosylase [Corynebacterium liangguodongii]|uniref:Adenine DNA glycosylase n=1 Tax=Corynebacterium liangguodongii TaxID=2079535 RepID=A0A2S0WFV7_9CORY|nr:A/G-specific adenine glycosylase [Corynebacterium liangguodongii]AWB84649.1 adenine glycosylase [Corynebacterium liangguodongii]PWB99657.1 A/G-specific adenine glycosylase [Corynebacterium liangguodongii]
MQSEVISYFRAHGRPLPWREPGTSPWGVLVSEVMSQQTPVSRVAPVWLEWMERWPTPEAFAAAGPDEVLRAWGSLGYPRRALRLHECAKVVVERHSGVVPGDVDTLLALPGIGAYTARAVACFAYDKNVAVVDTNVRRVYARAVEGVFLAHPHAGEISAVEALLPERDGPVFSAGLMELGALVCQARAPRCERCPISQRCAWLAAGRPEPDAEQLRRRKVQKFIGTDRQVRGKIMKLIRSSPGAVTTAQVEEVWPDAEQRARALDSLLDDGLAVRTPEGTIGLPRM